MSKDQDLFQRSLSLVEHQLNLLNPQCKLLLRIQLFKLSNYQSLNLEYSSFEDGLFILKCLKLEERILRDLELLLD
jgi:hypothetical protein